MIDDTLAEAGRVLGALDPVGDTDTTLQYVVSGAPDGKLQIGVVIDAGRISSITEGKLADPEITVTLSYDEALALLAGDTTADAAYMRGAVKVEGAHAVWLLDLRELRSAALEALAGVSGVGPR
jgi:putative sterol carrier protein